MESGARGMPLRQRVMVAPSMRWVAALSRKKLVDEKLTKARLPACGTPLRTMRSLAPLSSMSSTFSQPPKRQAATNRASI